MHYGIGRVYPLRLCRYTYPLLSIQCPELLTLDMGVGSRPLFPPPCRRAAARCPLLRWSLDRCSALSRRANTITVVPGRFGTAPHADKHTAACLWYVHLSTVAPPLPPSAGLL